MALKQRPSLLLLGGSFNPPHSGHLRMLLEAKEALCPKQTLLLPCAVPPHKTSSNLLPFELRCRMLRAALADMGSPADISVSQLEQERDGPSYTADTVRILAERYPELRLAFLLGNDDFQNMGRWPRSQAIPNFADLIVLPRGLGGPEQEAASFADACKRLWPEAEAEPSPCDGSIASYALHPLSGGGRFILLPQPKLEISSSLVRQRWLAGRSIDFLVPRGVAELIREQEKQIKAVWSNSGV